MIDERLSSLVRRNYSSLWKLVRRCGVDAASADDAVQETFLVAARRLDAIRDGSEQAFLYGVAIRVASSFRRKRSRRFGLGPLGDELDQQATTGPLPDEELDARRARALLDAALDQMSEKFRTVLVLHEFEGMAVRDIAVVLDIPEGTATSRLRRAREEFSEIAKRIRSRRDHGRPASGEGSGT